LTMYFNNLCIGNVISVIGTNFYKYKMDSSLANLYFGVGVQKIHFTAIWTH